MTTTRDPHATPLGRPRWHAMAEAALPALASVVAFAPVAVWSRLPDPVASHWDLGGAPDGALGRVADTALLAAMIALLAVGPLLAARVPMPRAQARLLVAAAGGGSVLLAGVRLAALRANLDAPTWEAAGALTLATIALVGLVAALAAAVGWAAAAARPDLAPATSAPRAVAVAPGEAVVWSGGADSRVARWVPVGLLAATALAAVVVPPGPRLVIVTTLPVIAVVLAAIGQVRVTVGPRGLTAALGWFAWPRLKVPMGDVAGVAVEDVAPLSYGGWGVRIVPGAATAVVVRSGEALRIERHGRRAFVVTVDDAARAAGVLEAHRGHAHGGA